jgi:hypothetical protein
MGKTNQRVLSRESKSKDIGRSRSHTFAVQNDIIKGVPLCLVRCVECVQTSDSLCHSVQSQAMCSLSTTRSRRSCIASKFKQVSDYFLFLVLSLCLLQDMSVLDNIMLLVVQWLRRGSRSPRDPTRGVKLTKTANTNILCAL